MESSGLLLKEVTQSLCNSLSVRFRKDSFAENKHAVIGIHKSE